MKNARKVLKYSRREGVTGEIPCVPLKIRGEIEDNFFDPFSLSSEWKIKIYGFVSSDAGRCSPLANGWRRSIFSLKSEGIFRVYV